MIIKTQVSKKRNDIMNCLHLSMKDYEIIQNQMSSSKSCQFILRSLNGKCNSISQFIVKKSEDNGSIAILNSQAYLDDQEEYSELELIKNPIQISKFKIKELYQKFKKYFLNLDSKIQINISFISDTLNLLFLSQVLDVEDIIKRQIIRQNQIFCNNTILSVKMLESLVTLKIDSLQYEETEILNEMFFCTNMSLLEIHIDYSSLLKFKRFYRIPKSTYLFELTNLQPNEETQNSLQKLSQWLLYSSSNSQSLSDLQFLDSKIVTVTLKSNGTQQQEMKSQIYKYMLKKQIDLFNETQFDQLDKDISNDDSVINQNKFKIHYLNLRDIIQLRNEIQLQKFFSQVIISIKRGEETNSQQTLLILDSCEYLMEQDKHNENIGKFKCFQEFISQIRALLFITHQEKKQYFNLSEKISNIKLL